MVILASVDPASWGVGRRCIGLAGVSKKVGDGEIGKPNCYGMAVCAASAAVQDRDHRAARGCLPSRFGFAIVGPAGHMPLPVRSMVGRASLFWLDHLAITGLVPLPEPELPGLA